MRVIISRSAWRKLAVLVIAVVGFVFLYETQMFDTRTVLWSIGDGRPQPGSQLPFSATAYCKGTTTASGVGVRTGIAAADPALLPVGSVINIATGDSRYNGVYTVMDTGPKVQGPLLDLYMWSCHEALRFGRKDVQITVLRLGWDPRASSPSLIDRVFRRRDTARRVPPPDPPPPAGIAPDDGVPIEPESTDQPDSASEQVTPAAATGPSEQ